MFKILVVEDDRELNKALCKYLNVNGYHAHGCLNVESAYDSMYENVFDAIISDIMLPSIDGFEFAETVRKTNTEIPILFMTARDDIFSKKRGYRAGIDDYMVKPINFDELILHLGALLRRAGIAQKRKLTVGSFSMDISAHTASLNGEEIGLTVREFSLIYKLLSYPNRTFSRQQLMAEFWAADTKAGTRTVDVYMTRLRSKFSSCDDFEIVTVHGLGYKAVIK